jgi:hypothetical protein
VGPGRCCTDFHLLGPPLGSCAILLPACTAACSPAAAATGPLNPPPGFDPSCKAGVFLEAYYCYNRFNSTRVSRFCYDRDKCGAAPQGWEIDLFRDSLKACMQASNAQLWVA